MLIDIINILSMISTTFELKSKQITFFSILVFMMLGVHARADVGSHEARGPIWVRARADMDSPERAIMGLQSRAV